MDVQRQIANLHEMVAAAYRVFAEARNLNFKSPLQSNPSWLSLAEMSDNGPMSPSEAPTSSLMTESGAEIDTATSVTYNMPLHGDDVQDSFTKIAAFKSTYIRLSTELLENLQSLNVCDHNLRPLF
jgi:hypothetical protein